MQTARCLREGTEIAVANGLSLSSLHDLDKPALLRHLAEPAIADSMLRIPYPYTIADAHRWVTLARARARAFGREQVWAIREPQEGILVGCAGFESEPGSHKAEIGYWLAKPYWGRGWMTDVVQTLVQVGFQYGWTRLSASVFDDNLASARVLEKAGFRCEAKLAQYYVKNGRFYDARIYARLK